MRKFLITILIFIIISAPANAANAKKFSDTAKLAAGLVTTVYAAEIVVLAAGAIFYYVSALKKTVKKIFSGPGGSRNDNETDKKILFDYKDDLFHEF